jgi:hypothetical protein
MCSNQTGYHAVILASASRYKAARQAAVQDEVTQLTAEADAVLRQRR